MAVSFLLGFNCLVFSQRQEDSMCVWDFLKYHYSCSPDESVAS